MPSQRAESVKWLQENTRVKYKDLRPVSQALLREIGKPNLEFRRATSNVWLQPSCQGFAPDLIYRIRPEYNEAKPMGKKPETQIHKGEQPMKIKHSIQNFMIVASLAVLVKICILLHPVVMLVPWPRWMIDFGPRNGVGLLIGHWVYLIAAILLIVGVIALARCWFQAARRYVFGDAS